MHPLLLRLRQWTFPAPLRIHPASRGDVLHELALLAGALALRCREAGNSKAADGGLDADLALTLANSLYRLGRNLAGLEAKAPESRQLRSVLRAHQRIETCLKEHGVEWRDLSGEIYDVGRLDFERLGSAQPVAGLDRARIGRCERPVVMLRGELLQTARGVVKEPLSEADPQ